VHCIGETATEIIHIGQSVMAFDGTIEYFRDTVFNYPTMAECYKVAAFDGLNKLDLDQQLVPPDELEVELSRQALDLRNAASEMAAAPAGAV
jgi:NAD(P) transhydrogenase